MLSVVRGMVFALSTSLLACGTTTSGFAGAGAASTDGGSNATLPVPDAASFPDGCAPAPGELGVCEPSGSSSGGFPGYPVICDDSVTLPGSLGCTQVHADDALSGVTGYCCP